MKKRCEHEIMRDILQEASQANVKTRLLHKTNLNFKSFSGNLKILLLNNLLEKTEDQTENKEVYKTTDNGKEFLKLFAIIEEMVNGKKDKNLPFKDSFR